MLKIKFNKPYTAPCEDKYLAQWQKQKSSGIGGKFNEKCQELLNKLLKTESLHLTNSCTAALETAFLLIGIGPGDEVIMPSYTFSSTANAVCLRGATPVFVDVKPDTLNIDEKLVAQAITDKTRAIVAVHYAGVACNMNALLDLAKKNDLMLVEDAAQAVGSSYFGRPLGVLADYGAFSFHHTKNIQCGEGGALFTAQEVDFGLAANIIEKGTNRRDLIDGKVDKYNWVTLGSSYVVSDLQLALLASQLEMVEQVTAKRTSIWYHYAAALKELEDKGLLRRPGIELGAGINGHIFYVILDGDYQRDKISETLGKFGVTTLSHYEPLHLSPAGRRFGRIAGELKVTENVSTRLLRLPIWPDMQHSDADYVVDQLFSALAN